jgi:hypothetical protein
MIGISMKEFIFAPGTWLGEGKITFAASSEFIKFYMKWQISEESNHVMKAIQTIQMQGIEEKSINEMTFFDIHSGTFAVQLENEILGKVLGKGIYSDQVIAWEFHTESNFQGFETYERRENGDFFVHAEYGKNDIYRTIIEGLIWPKAI